MSAETAERPELTSPVPTPAPPPSPAPEPELGPLEGLTFFQKFALFCAPLMFAIFGWGGGTLFHDRVTAPPPPASATESPPDGARLYAMYCASCHGIHGDGKGVAEVYPRARYFGFDRFKFAHTKNGIPTENDLRNIIRNGIPGSAMPSFPQLTDAENQAIIAEVRHLTWNGAYTRFYKQAVKAEDEGGDPPDPYKIAKQATDYCKIEAPIPVPATFEPPTPESIARGRKVYLTSCVSCHGDKGKGDGPQVNQLKNEDGTPNVPRDLTSGVFKVSGEQPILYARIRLGIPGTPMPATPTLTDPEMNDLINYVRSLCPRPGVMASATAILPPGK